MVTAAFTLLLYKTLWLEDAPFRKRLLMMLLQPNRSRAESGKIHARLFHEHQAILRSSEAAVAGACVSTQQVCSTMFSSHLRDPFRKEPPEVFRANADHRLPRTGTGKVRGKYGMEVNSCVRARVKQGATATKNGTRETKQRGYGWLPESTPEANLIRSGLILSQELQPMGGVLLQRARECRLWVGWKVDRGVSVTATSNSCILSQRF